LKDRRTTQPSKPDNSSDEDDYDSGDKIKRIKKKTKLVGRETTPAKKSKTETPKPDTPATPSRSLCGTHLLKLAGLGSPCEHDPCRFTHATTLNAVNLDSLEACLNSNFGVKTGKTKCIKLWNNVCTRTKATDRTLPDT